MSRETEALIGWMSRSGVPHRVTDVVRYPIVTNGSYHSRMGTGGPGLAVDFAGPVRSEDSPALAAVYAALEPLGPKCAELIYSGPGGGFWATGRQRDPTTYTAAVVDDHHDHVHIAVPLGFTWSPPEVPMPAIPIVAAFSHEAGYVLVAADGAVYCFGCDYKGGLRWDGTAWVLR